MDSQISMHLDTSFEGSAETQEALAPNPAGVQPAVQAESKEVIQPYATSWARLCDSTQSPPFYRPEWISVLVQCFEPHSRLSLLTAHQSERLTAVLPLVWKHCWFAGIPVTKLMSTANIHSVCFDFPTACGHDGEDSVAQVWNQLKNTPGWHVVELPLIPEEGSSQRLLTRAKEDGFTVLQIPFHESPILRMQAGKDGRLNPLAGVSRHFRHELRRFARLYQEATGQEPRVVRRDAPEPEILEKFYVLEAAGWKGEANSAINCSKQTRDFYHEIAKHAAANGYFSLYSLETDEAMIAAAFCVETQNCMFPMKIAYDERLHRAGPGQLLFNGILADCAERQIPTLFFGGQKNRFKTSWTSETVPYFTGFIFNRGVRPRLAHRSRVSLVSRLGMVRRELKKRLRSE